MTTAWLEISLVAQGFLCSVLALILTLSLADAVIAFYYRVKKRYLLAATASLAVQFLYLCLLYEGYLKVSGDLPDDASISPVSAMPLWSVLVLTAVFALTAVTGLCFLVKYIRTHLTAMSVKEGLDRLPTGLCFYDREGLPLLLNERINAECVAVTGEPLLDGRAFWTHLSEGNLPDGFERSTAGEAVILKFPGGEVKNYRRITHMCGAETVYEIVGGDVSGEYALGAALTEKNRELKALNARLREYGDRITEFTRERESLQAKIRIHDALGSLLLMTRKSLTQGADEELAAVARQWEDVTGIIGAAEENKREDGFAELTAAAEAIGAEIHLAGDLPRPGTVEEKIVLQALHECLTNTVRHGDGNAVEAYFSESNGNFRAQITNNGGQPKGEIREGGGLTSLRKLAESEGGSMHVTIRPRFELSITVPMDGGKLK